MTAPLWHYTCDHGLARITEGGGFLTPNLMLAPAVLWLTDLDEPDRDGLGLTMHRLACDRTAHRFRIDEPTDVAPWSVARRWFRPTWAETLERAPGARPEHWYVTRIGQQARLDERGAA